MSECDSCGMAEAELSLRDIEKKAERKLTTVYRIDGSPVGFPVDICVNPLCEYGPDFSNT